MRTGQAGPQVCLSSPLPTTDPPATYPLPPCGRQNADRAERACAELPVCHRGAAAGWGLQSVTPTLPPRATGIQFRRPVFKRMDGEDSQGRTCRVLCGVDSKTCSAYHAQGGEPTHQQPEEVEEGMKVNVIGDEQDNTVPEQAIALGRER